MEIFLSFEGEWNEEAVSIIDINRDHQSYLREKDQHPNRECREVTAKRLGAFSLEKCAG